MNKDWKRYITSHCFNLWSSSPLEQDGDTHPVECLDEPQAFVDLPGMIMADRSIQTLHVHGLTVMIPSEDLRTFYGILVETREDEGKTSLRGFTSTVLLDPDEVDVLLYKMERVLPEADRLAEKEGEEFRRRMNEIRILSPIGVESWKEGRGVRPPNVSPNTKKN